ncbi:MAG TPA: hypothetical protein VFQ40_01605 [Actinomycetota bacterium]|nr:hypothetical protein [Actinomycetota bacterium]
MSVNAQTIEVAPRSAARAVLAIVAALVIGAGAGSVVTQAVTSEAPTTEAPAEVLPWDQQKLDAMDGRQAAETVEVPAIGIAPWDDQKLDAMEGAQAAASR